MPTSLHNQFPVVSFLENYIHLYSPEKLVAIIEKQKRQTHGQKSNKNWECILEQSDITNYFHFQSSNRYVKLITKAGHQFNT